MDRFSGPLAQRLPRSALSLGWASFSATAYVLFPGTSPTGRGGIGRSHLSATASTCLLCPLWPSPIPGKLRPRSSSRSPGDSQAYGRSNALLLDDEAGEGMGLRSEY